jgi:hypothetical protein
MIEDWWLVVPVLHQLRRFAMFPRGQRTTFQQRLLISESATAGQTDRQTADQLHCSRWTVRKWRRRAQRAGRAGLTSHLGRRPTGPLGTMAPDLAPALRQLRTAHPGWGPHTLLAALHADPYWRSQHLPSRARVAAWLKHAGLTRPYRRHVPLPQPPAAPALAPHDEWQLDAQGAVPVSGLGTVSVINVVDETSRLKVESCPRVACRHPATADYYVTLRRAFLTYGLPRRLSLDHDTVFFDNTTPSPFPTRLHLWLLALGIDVVFTRPRCPTDHALVERTHQTLYHQAIEGQTWSTQEQLWRGLDERREVLNTEFPLRRLAQQAPLRAYPAAVASGRPYRPEGEEELLDLERVYGYLGQSRWFRPLHHGRFELGTHKYWLTSRLADQQLEIHFDAASREFICQPEQGGEPVRCAAKGLSKEYLMGELATIAALPTYQLALPWSAEAIRQQDLVQLLGTSS